MPTTIQHRDYPSGLSAPHRSSSKPELPLRRPEINPAVHLQQETESPSQFQVPSPHRSISPYESTGPYATATLSPTGLLHGIDLSSARSSARPSPHLTETPAPVGPGLEDILSRIYYLIRIISFSKAGHRLPHSTSAAPSHLPEAPERRSHPSSRTQVLLPTTTSVPNPLHTELSYWGASHKAFINTTVVYSGISTPPTQIPISEPWVLDADSLRGGGKLNQLRNLPRLYVSLDSLEQIRPVQSSFAPRSDNWLQVQVGPNTSLLIAKRQLRYLRQFIMAPGKRKSSQLQLQGSQDVDMADSPMALTPARTEGLLTPSSRPSSYAGPVTRSMARSGLADSLEVVILRSSSRTLAERLQASVKRPMKRLKLSKLEDAKDLDDTGGDDDGDGYGGESIVGDYNENGSKRTHQLLPSPQVANSPGNHPSTGQLRVLSRQSAVAYEDDPVSDESATTPARKRARTLHNIPAGSLRRSPRFLKPLTEFHKYPDLPPELKLMIWEAAVEPRLIYICNRASSSHNNRPFGVQNRLPSWFAACHISVSVALRLYKKRFDLIPLPFGPPSRRTIQDVNLDHDIVIFEPCHNGCRGCHCARHQYSDDDRAAVRFLVVQTESPHLLLGSEPCWESVSRSWPNVETLYLMRVAVKGVNTRDKAMLRVTPNEHENALQKEFEQWKKGMGANRAMEKLEFVVVVDKEVSSTDSKALYKSVQDRKTGLPEDIILG
ncbi:hypothetical protein Hte_006477 [Hypoxylon texense]